MHAGCIRTFRRYHSRTDFGLDMELSPKYANAYAAAYVVAYAPAYVSSHPAAQHFSDQGLRLSVRLNDEIPRLDHCFFPIYGTARHRRC